MFPTFFLNFICGDRKAISFGVAYMVCDDKKSEYAESFPNAHGVTKWGLDYGYVTGEWWRGDPRARWWEYCMYDWKNRYNYSHYML